jgi:hypothetical protein
MVLRSAAGSCLEDGSSRSWPRQMTTRRTMRRRDDDWMMSFDPDLDMEDEVPGRQTMRTSRATQ